jgi:hypothetical protein
MEFFMDLPFEQRLLFFAVPFIVVSWIVAWLVRLPLGRFRKSIPALLGASVVGAFAAGRLVSLVVGPSAWFVGLVNPLAIPTLCLLPFAAEFVRLRLRWPEGRRWLAPVAAVAVLLAGLGLLRLSVDRADGERRTSQFLIERHLQAHFWEPSWKRVIAASRAHFPNETEGAFRRHDDAILAALRSGDKAALDRADTRIAFDLFDIPGTVRDSWAKASDATLLRVGRARLALLDRMANDPELCANFAMAGAFPNRRVVREDLSAPMTELNVAEIGAAASGRDNHAAPPHPPLSESGMALFRSELEKRLPPELRQLIGRPIVGRPDPAAFCTMERAALSAALSLPGGAGAALLARQPPPFHSQ